jgi:predicted metal-dependent hydrolase
MTRYTVLMFLFRKIRRRARGLTHTRTRVRRLEYKLHSERARELIHQRLSHFQAFYAQIDPTFAARMQFGRVSIRDQRSRWGSCSSRKNLNFNYRLIHLSPEHRDYVIVHELCHLIEMNHGAEFWRLVELAVPNARTLQAVVKRINMKTLKI